MFKYKKGFLLLSTLLFSLYTIAQTASSQLQPDQEDFMRSGGKIYVVMVVSVTVLAGLLIYVARLDKKMSKLEQRE